MVKTALSLHHGQIPPTLHFRAANPDIDLDGLRLRVCQRPTAWPEGKRPVAGVSSFGLGGTNGHAVLAAAPPSEMPSAPPAEAEPVAAPLPFVVSGRNPAGLSAQAAALADALTDAPADALADALTPDAGLRSVALSLGATRAALRQRGAVLATDLAGLTAGLRRLAEGEGLIAGQGEGGVAYLFPGQGMQRAGMGRALCAAYPVFARTFDEISAAMEPSLGTTLRELMWQREDWLDALEYAQPAMFALEVALYRLHRVVGPGARLPDRPLPGRALGGPRGRRPSRSRTRPPSWSSGGG